MFLVLQTAVTSVPNVLAIWTANVPTPPDAPFISTRRARPIRPFRRPVGWFQRQRLLRRNREFRVRTEAAPGEFSEHVVARTELGDVAASCFDAPGDIVTNDLEFWFAKPSDETEWQWRPAQQMPVACVG
jgi:hypothetical protein